MVATSCRMVGQGSGEEEEDNAEPGEVMNEQAPQVSNAASPV